MNRKAKSKLVKKVEQAKMLHFANPYDDPLNWLRGDFEKPPWPVEKIAEYQKKLDSAFGGENAIILAWSGDRKYGDAFYTDWYPNGLPKGKLERKPPLLFAEQKVSETDYFYVSCPRWLLLEVLHVSQYEAGWETASWVDAPEMIGGRKRIRAEKPPLNMYKHILIIAEHDQTQMSHEVPQCCVKMLNQKRICYGRYKEPSEVEISHIRGVRQDQDHRGVVQRNDAATSKKLIEESSLATKHFIKRAQEQQALGVQDMMLANSKAFFGDLLEKTGSTKSFKELEAIVREGFEKQNEERFS
jgi:hypothetical protein